MKTLRLMSFVVVCCFLLSVGLVTAQENITLVVWDVYPTSPQSDIHDQLNAEFMENHPGVTVQRTAFSFQQLTAVTKLGVANEDGPDVVMVAQGWGDMGALVAADLLLPLNDYAEQYGWNERWAPGLLARNSFSADGTEFGSGNLYGVSTTAELGGIYYHRDMFAERGLEAPTTFEELVNIFDTFAEEGIRPLSVGMVGYLDMHYAALVIHAYNEVDWTNDYIFQRNNARFDIPENIEAAQTIQEWTAQYLPEDFQGIDRNTARSLFYNKEHPMLIEGSWLSANIVEQGLGDEVGFFLIPHHTEGHLPLQWGGWGLAWGIRKTSDHHDLAAEYIEWHTSEHAAELWIAAGDIPAVGIEDRSQVQYAVQNDLLDAWEAANATNSIGHFLDWASPTMFTTLNEQLDLLETGQITPEEFVAAIQADYESS